MHTPRTSVGIDVGGTKIAAGLVSDGQLLRRRELPTPQGDLATLLDALRDCAAGLLDGVDAIGVCTPGLHDPHSGRISYAGNLPMLKDTDLAAEFSRHSSRRVTVSNDADAAAWAEFELGAGRAWHSCFYLTVSTGIGGGFASAAGLFRGFRGAATEVGHLLSDPSGERCSCGQYGCLETVASGRAIARRASVRSGRELSTRAVFGLARDGEPVAVQVLAAAAGAIGAALAAVSQLFDPEGIVLGGSVVLNNPEFLEQLRCELAARVSGRELPLLAPAGLGADAGILGAALLAAREQP